MDGIGRFISLDGGGLSVVSKAVGSLRYKVTFSGPGGHSYGSFGMANPIHAMGRAIDAISEFRVPTDPRTTFNVGRVGGGTSVNAIAAQAWMEVDLRSSDGPRSTSSIGGFARRSTRPWPTRTSDGAGDLRSRRR